MVVGLTALVAALGGTALAAIPSGGGTYTGCYVTSSGALRVIDPAAGQACSGTEQQITWNKQGPTGPKGATGTRGPTGPAGQTGTTGPAGAKGPTGPKGSTGSRGPTGPAGPTGPRGADGQDGTPMASAYGGFGSNHAEVLGTSEQQVISLRDGGSGDIVVPFANHLIVNASIWLEAHGTATVECWTNRANPGTPLIAMNPGMTKATVKDGDVISLSVMGEESFLYPGTYYVNVVCDTAQTPSGPIYLNGGVIQAYAFEGR